MGRAAAAADHARQPSSRPPGEPGPGCGATSEPLDIHLWTDVPVPELGPVEPVLWSELEAGLDGLMLASGGVWLETIRDAVQAYKGLFTVEGLKSAARSSVGVHY